MRKAAGLLCFVMVMLYGTAAMAATAVSSDGYYNGIKLCGKVRVVEHFADIKVKVVDSFLDLRVKIVSSFPDDVGKWQFVEYGEDFMSIPTPLLSPLAGCPTGAGLSWMLRRCW